MLRKILYTGIYDGMDGYMRDKVYLSNAIAILLELIGVGFIVISLLFTPEILIFPLLGGVICGIFVLLLNKHGYHTLSRVMVAIFPSINSTLYIASVIQDNESIIPSLLIIALTFVLFTFLVADQREPKIFIPLMIYAGLLLFFMERLIYWVDVPLSSQPFRSPILNTVDYFIGIGGLFYLLLFLLKKNLGSEKQNLNLIYALEIQKNEVSTQNEELYQQQEEMQAQRDFIASKNDELSRKNKQIQNSIRAASTIQQAVLPSPERLSKYFTDYFLIYRPKDVVSGDFYWVTRHQGSIFLITVDCTGHGVPGAFMTLIAHNLLDRIVRIGNVVSPAAILNQMHDEIQLVLHQKDTNNTSGMDGVVVSITPQDSNYEIQMAGAKTGLFYKLPADSKLTEIKGTRKSVGGFQVEKLPYREETFTLVTGSFIYLGSDGLEDQNNLRRKKFTRGQIRSVLEAHTQASLQTQKEALQTALSKHMEGAKQRDDILWMGVKL